jgi:hypothetical protein
MKLNIPDRLARIDWSQLKRAALVPFAIIIAVAFIGFVADGGAGARSFGRKYPNPSSTKTPRGVILYIGDSLSIGRFGDILREHLEDNNYRVAFFASCGSSPENWLPTEPDYRTRCGYRDFTPESRAKRDFEHYTTPKLDVLINRYTPKIVIVQQGTNWMDRPLTDEKIYSFIERFVRIARGSGERKVIWIGPPDSSRFTARKQDGTYSLIERGVGRSFVINSRPRVTHYEPGKTGPDGIHYNRESATAWAHKVIAKIDEILTREKL